MPFLLPYISMAWPTNIVPNYAMGLLLEGIKYTLMVFIAAYTLKTLKTEFKQRVRERRSTIDCRLDMNGNYVI